MSQDPQQEQQRPSVTLEAGGLLVGDAGLPEDWSSQRWEAQTVDGRRVLLTSEEGRTGVPQPVGLASCATPVFKELLVGLHHSGWSGVVAVDTGYGVKRVFFTKGDVVFAASNVIDDRLGEVIYREARISLDELTNSAAQVTKARKFGQVLLSSGIFTNVQLWDALKLQARQILRSLFMVDKVYFELQAGAGLAPTEVIFVESAPELLGDCYSYGCAFRAFLGKLRVESVAELLVPRETMLNEHEPQTFVGDLIALIEQHANIQELLDASKLIDAYTIAALLGLVNQGLCRITPAIDDGSRPPALAQPLKAKLDAYAYALQAVRRAFADAGREFPLADLCHFAASLNPEGFPSLYLDGQGNVPRDCAGGLFSQCAANPARVGYFGVRVESLSQFLLQVAGDNLDFKVAKQIRLDYRAVTA